MKEKFIAKRGYLLIALAVAAAGLAFSTAGAEQAPGVPVAVFGPVKYSWQSIIEGQKVKHSFTVRNKGNADLIIEQVKTS
jgi:hypothetical protein